MSIFPKDWGTYPKEYNREVHGPYNPSVYYGKRDTPFEDVKLGELTSWLARRNKSPRAMAAAISRAWFRYKFKWIDVKQPGGAFLYQFIAVSALSWFILDYSNVKKERNYRYH